MTLVKTSWYKRFKDISEQISDLKQSSVRVFRHNFENDVAITDKNFETDLSLKM